MQEEYVSVLLRVPQQLLGLLDKACGGKGGGGRSRIGGRAGWVLNHLYKHFGLPGADLAKPIPPLPSLVGVDIRALDVKTRYIIDLHQKGLSIKELVAHLKSRGIPTPKGGEWSETTVKGVILRLARRAKVATDRKDGKKVTKGAKGL